MTTKWVVYLDPVTDRYKYKRIELELDMKGVPNSFTTLDKRNVAKIRVDELNFLRGKF